MTLLCMKIVLYKHLLKGDAHVLLSVAVGFFIVDMRVMLD